MTNGPISALHLLTGFIASATLNGDIMDGDEFERDPAIRRMRRVFAQMEKLQQEMLEAGKLRILAICAPQRSKEHPQIPTAKELGYDFSWDAWEAIFGPKGLKENKAVYQKLSEAIRKTIQDPDLGHKLLNIGLAVNYKPGDELEKWLREDDKRVKKTIYELGLEYK